MCILPEARVVGKERAEGDDSFFLQTEENLGLRDVDRRCHASSCRLGSLISRLSLVVHGYLAYDYHEP